MKRLSYLTLNLKVFLHFIISFRTLHYLLLTYYDAVKKSVKLVKYFKEIVISRAFYVMANKTKTHATHTRLHCKLKKRTPRLLRYFS